MRGAMTGINAAAANTQVVGRTIAVMFNELTINGGFRASNFECVGHSLGAHVCSYAGKSYNLFWFSN